MQNGCPELEMCFSRAELDSRPGEARLVVQSATPDLDLRDQAMLLTPGNLYLWKISSIDDVTLSLKYSSLELKSSASAYVVYVSWVWSDGSTKGAFDSRSSTSRAWALTI